MEVILLQDVAKIGRRYAVVEVPDGYARNKLIPMKAAVPATPDNRKRYGAITAHATAAKAEREASVAAALTTLKGITIRVTGRGNDKGHLYEAITASAIAAAATAAGASLAAEDIVLPRPLKEVGDHTVAVSCGGVKGDIVITVVAGS